MRKPNSTTTEAQGRLRHLLEEMRRYCGRLPSEYFYAGTADFVLREGRFFEPGPLPEGIGRKEIKQCFRNARQVTASNGLQYVEGFALSEAAGVPQLHAWNVDAQGRVVDTTWVPFDESAWFVGIAYLGVGFSLLDTLKCPGSLIDNWENRWPLLREPFRARIDVLD